MEAMVHRGRGLPPRDLLRRNQDFPKTDFFSNGDPSRVRSGLENVAILPRPSYNPFPHDMLVTLVTHPSLCPRSRMFLLVIPFQRFGQIWFVHIFCRPKMFYPWKGRARLGGRSRIKGAVPAGRVEGQCHSPTRFSQGRLRRCRA